MIDIGLLHQFEELARIGRERLDIAALPLGIDGVEREARFARARQAGDHRERVAGDVDRDILEVVLARAAPGNGRGRTEEGRVGKEGVSQCRMLWTQYHEKKKEERRETTHILIQD